MSNNQQWNRRSFLFTMSGAGAALMLNPLLSWAATEQDPRVARYCCKNIWNRYTQSH
ncbi:hypothetical protein [Flavobacterium ginsengisoli]|uniref:hypothetical protein n=1 Tax=Flavobacterium ginsengisoli TaxID=871694 RepID=UPI002414DB28|nr:hypothetical protein [Flavobacterium ginsengisoli]